MAFPPPTSTKNFLILRLIILPAIITSSSPIIGATLTLQQMVSKQRPLHQWSSSISRLNQFNMLLAGLDCRNPDTQAAINNCAVNLAKESDNTLNQTYQQLRSTLSTAQEKLLINAQLTWIKFRDEHCALEKGFLDDSTLSITTQLSCLRRMSDRREQELQSLLNVRNFYGKPIPTQLRASENVQAATLIGPDRIGPVVIGKTYGELQRSLSGNDSLQANQNLMVDINAIPLVREGKTLLYILFPKSATVTDTSVIRSLLTKNPTYKTKEGVGIGMTIAEAERIYGEATLSYNTSNESREYVTFSKQPTRQIRFGVKMPDQGLAGIYSSRGEYNQSQRYHGTAYIAFIQVIAP